MNPDFSASLTRFVDDYVLENDFFGYFAHHGARRYFI